MKPIQEQTIHASRQHHLKRDAERELRWLKKHGVTGVITGKRGMWRWAAKVPPLVFAKFLTMEAMRVGE